MSNNEDSIPHSFHSDSDEKPFTMCKVCSKDLTKGDVPYSIEKAFKKTEEGEDLTLFELAICVPCAEKQSKKMSAASRAFIQETMMTQTFFERRSSNWENNWKDTWNKKCIFSDREVQNNEEYHIVGHFVGDRVIQGQTPFVLGPEILEYIQEHLSPETKEELDNFGNQFLGPDPRIAALLEDYQFVMV